MNVDGRPDAGHPRETDEPTAGAVGPTIRQIEGKAVRQEKWPLWLRVYIPGISLVPIIISLAASNWNWPVIVGAVVGGIGIGAFLGVVFRNRLQ